MRTCFIALLMISICGCATNPDKISTAYVSPLTYQHYDCDQIAREMTYIQRRTTELYSSLKKERKKDNWMMGIGLVVFWPTLFGLSGGDGPEAAEYSQLKGQHDALRQVSVDKKCLNISTMTLEEMIKAGDVVKDDDSTTQLADPELTDTVATTSVRRTPENPDSSPLRAVTEFAKQDGEFLGTVAKGTGGMVDGAENTERAMSLALKEAAKQGADSYYLVDISSSGQSTSVVLESLNCQHSINSE